MVPGLRALFLCLKFFLENLFLFGNFIDIHAYRYIKRQGKRGI